MIAGLRLSSENGGGRKVIHNAVPSPRKMKQKSVLETKMLRWCRGIQGFVRIPNDTARTVVGVASIYEKLRESQLCGFGKFLIL